MSGRLHPFLPSSHSIYKAADAFVSKFKGRIQNGLKTLLHIIIDRLPVLEGIANDAEGFQGGITPFDSYANWMAYYTFGVNTLYPDGPAGQHAGVPQQGLTDGERETILGSVEQNITSLAKQYPDVAFYYFFPPYSGSYWQSIVDAGTFDKQKEAERLIIREILKVNNISLFSFNNLTGITMDLNHYKDANHYAEWINSLMLKYMHDGKCRLTLEQFHLAVELVKVIKHFFPDLVRLLKQTDDPRNQSYITYPNVILLLTRILSSIFYISSMRKTSQEFNSETVIQNICYFSRGGEIRARQVGTQMSLYLTIRYFKIKYDGRYVTILIQLLAQLNRYQEVQLLS